MRKQAIVLLMAAFVAVGCAHNHQVTRGRSKMKVSSMSLWPEGKMPWQEQNPTGRKPTLTFHLPDAEKANGTAVIVCPGGGYAGLSMEHEGHAVARWLRDIGIAGIVLSYRHSGTGFHHPAPIQDAQRALSVVRANAGRYAIDPNKVGMIGFSAGGHLVSTAATHFDTRFYDSIDTVDEENIRPNFTILIYPAISTTSPEWVNHEYLTGNLFGPYPEPEWYEQFSSEKQVTGQTPPAFLAHSYMDEVVPAQQSIEYWQACKEAAVPAELHILQTGPHGKGIQGGYGAISDWPELCERWLKTMGMLKDE